MIKSDVIEKNLVTWSPTGHGTSGDVEDFTECGYGAGLEDVMGRGSSKKVKYITGQRTWKQ